MPQFSPSVALCCEWWPTCGASLSPPPPGGLRGGERLQADSDRGEAQDTLLRPSTDRRPPAHEEQRSQRRQVHHHRLITRRSASAPQRCYVCENAPDGFPSSSSADTGWLKPSRHFSPHPYLHGLQSRVSELGKLVRLIESLEEHMLFKVCCYTWNFLNWHFRAFSAEDHCEIDFFETLFLWLRLLFLCCFFCWSETWRLFYLLKYLCTSLTYFEEANL